MTFALAPKIPHTFTSNLMTNFSPYDTQIDVEMAVSLHKALPMSRRMASDMRMWAWLAVEHAGYIVNGITKIDRTIKNRDFCLVIREIFPVQINNSRHVAGTFH